MTKRKYNQGGAFPLTQQQGALVGIGQGLGGTDVMGNALPGAIPGGGIISGAADVLGGIGDIIGAGKDIKRNRKLKQKAKGRIQDFYNQEAAGKFDMLTAQAERDLATAGLRRTDTTQFGQNQATSLAALSSDPRALLGGAAGIQKSADAAALSAQQADLGRELAAKGRLAGAEQRTLDANRSLDRALGMRKLGMAEADKAQAVQNIEASRQARREGIGNVVSGLANVGIGLVTGGMAPKIGGGGNRFSRSQNRTIANIEGGDLGGGRGYELSDGSTLNPNIDLGAYAAYGGEYQEGGQIPEEKPMGGDLLSELLGKAEGRNMDKTPGEFSHESNPIHMIDENGQKVGEATGGEYILNPMQAEEIDEMQQEIADKVENGKKPSRDELMLLYKAVRGVFSQPQFDE